MEEEGHECQDDPDHGQDLGDVGRVMSETVEAEDCGNNGDDKEHDGPIEHGGIPFGDDVNVCTVSLR